MSNNGTQDHDFWTLVRIRHPGVKATWMGWNDRLQGSGYDPSYEAADESIQRSYEEGRLVASLVLAAYSAEFANHLWPQPFAPTNLFATITTRVSQATAGNW